MLKVGRQAPDFVKMDAYVDGEIEQVSLNDYRDKWVVLFFYPADFSFVCPTELRELAERKGEFDEQDTVILGASTDSIYSHTAWFEEELSEVNFPVIADPTHELSEAYGVLEEEQGLALRGTFIIDPDGVVKYQLVSDLNTGRSVEETLRVLKALQTGEMCPVDWAPGEETLE